MVVVAAVALVVDAAFVEIEAVQIVAPLVAIQHSAVVLLVVVAVVLMFLEFAVFAVVAAAVSVYF